MVMWWASAMLGCFERKYTMPERMQDGPKAKEAGRKSEAKSFGGSTGEAFAVPKLMMGKRIAKSKKDREKKGKSL